jgi:hypothetical protein
LNSTNFGCSSIITKALVRIRPHVTRLFWKCVPIKGSFKVCPLNCHLKPVIIKMELWSWVVTWEEVKLARDRVQWRYFLPVVGYYCIPLGDWMFCLQDAQYSLMKYCNICTHIHYSSINYICMFVLQLIIKNILFSYEIFLLLDFNIIVYYF